jgi:hypothetical protein
MKKYILLVVLPMILLSSCIGAEEKAENNVENLGTVENESKESKYMGNWFEIIYPSDFIASPTEPLTVWEEISYIETDEASFSSPEGEVEFFVFSPQWDGEPKDYLDIRENEELLDEKTSQDEIYLITEKLFKEKSGLYFRKAESIRETLGDTKLHHVFGIKYKSEEDFEKYEQAYESFKASLVQFAD